jgi:shikimate dehydrogenase
MFLVGLIGRGIQASLSPALHERAAAREGFRYIYRLIDLEELQVGPGELPRLLRDAEREGYRGVNITHPCKQTVIPHLDELSDDARAIGAVNTVVFQDGRRTGYNTDCWGFAEAFRASASHVRTETVVQLGAGGAGAAVAHAALGFGTRRLMIVDKDPLRAERLAADLCTRFGRDRAISTDDVAAAMKGADGLIHATPTGMASYPGLPLSAELITPSHWVAEIVYFPLETELLRVARHKGCHTIDGSGMAVYQAVGAFQLFTSVTPDAALMRKDFDELVTARGDAPAVASVAAQ